MTRIVERLMRAGTFSLDMKGQGGRQGGTPKSVLDELRSACGQEPDGTFIPTDGHIVITSARIDASTITGNLADVALWQGRLTAADGARKFSGHDMPGWLGRPSGTIPRSVYRATIDPGGLAQWVTSVEANGITSGTVTDPGGTWPTIWQFASHLEQLDAACENLGAEWRINPNGTIDAGTVAALYPTVPTVFFSRESAGTKEGDLRAVRSTTLAPSIDSNNRATRTWVVGSDPSNNIFGVSTPDELVAYDQDGNATELERLVDAPEIVEQSEMTTTADTVQGRWEDPQTSFDISVSGDRWRHFVNPGELAWAWYPDVGILDIGTPVFEFGGQPVSPRLVRVQQVEWAPSEGDGVYLLRKDKDPLDITDWVVTGSGGRVTAGVGNGLADLDEYDRV